MGYKFMEIKISALSRPFTEIQVQRLRKYVKV